MRGVNYVSQIRLILEALKRGESLTPLDALRRFNSFRLAARIYELRRVGYHIVTIMEYYEDKRWARYVMVNYTTGSGGDQPDDNDPSRPNRKIYRAA